MAAFLESYKKGIYCGLLMAAWIVLDYLKVDDPTLKWTIVTLVGSITGFGGLQSLPGFPGNGAVTKD